MSDLISRSALIEKIEERIQSGIFHGASYYMLERFKVMVRDAPAVEAKSVEWIPCSERLPEEAGFYIVTKRQKSGEIQVALGSYRPLFNEWSGNGNFKDVLAWMPLPEPYREDDES